MLAMLHESTLYSKLRHRLLAINRDGKVNCTFSPTTRLVFSSSERWKGRETETERSPAVTNNFFCICPCCMHSHRGTRFFFSFFLGLDCYIWWAAVFCFQWKFYLVFNWIAKNVFPSRKNSIGVTWIFSLLHFFFLDMHISTSRWCSFPLLLGQCYPSRSVWKHRSFNCIWSFIMSWISK